MKNFVNEFKSMGKALEERGFTLYDGDEPCFIAKYAKNAYVVIASDFESAQIWFVNREITDDEFAHIMTANCKEYDLLWKNSTIFSHPLTWAVGYNIPEKYRGVSK